MAGKSPPIDLPTRHFASAKEFETFLDCEHATSQGVYVKLAKKGSGIASISGPEAVETALCYGWIDGRANGIDDKWWTVRYTPRRPKSVWSQKNVKTIERLMAANRMKPSGIAAVEAAKSDGRWERAYAGPATISVPQDLASALADEPAASKTFEAMDKKNRYAVLWRIETATPSNRANRVETLVQMLAEGKSVHVQDYPSMKRKVKAEVQENIDEDVKPESTPKRRQTTQENVQVTRSQRSGLRSGKKA